MLNTKFTSTFIVLFICLLGIGKTYAQELNFSVAVKAPQLNTTDERVIKTLEKEIEEFLNNTKWTDDDFEDEERIEGNLLITITRENGANNFVSDFTIQSIRPVFNSEYKTQLLNYKDEGYNFSYQENQPIRNSSEKYFDNLSTILTFYAYVVLGLDYDSFSKLGGQPYFEIANNIITSLPSSLSNSGQWAKTSNRKSRFWLMENITSPRLRTMREALYSFHRRGLDAMSEDAGKGKAVILSSLKVIQKANTTYPNSMLVRMFGDCKNEEVVEVFQIADRAEKLLVYEIMVGIDPYRTNKYNALKR
ncbi:DUF4835 family protein [Saprospiraceae bacterium]|nr:DUF4835 family protein [Saprospiraceae bacterium]